MPSGHRVAIVVDASIVIKWLVDEDDSPLALALRATQNTSAPDFVLIECRNVLLTKTRKKLLLPGDAMRVENAIRGVELELLPSQRFLTEAFALALELGEPIYDCIYLAAAIATECKLVTANARFAKTANRFAASKDRVALLSSFIG